MRMTTSTLRYARYLLATLASVAFVLDWPITGN
jgi:hypothetical protein